MKITLALIGHRGRSGPLPTSVLDFYLKRLAAYTEVESLAFRAEPEFFAGFSRARTRTPSRVILLDSRGTSLSSEAFAAWIGKHRDAGQQNLVFAIGPADGWTPQGRAQAQTLLSLGPMTLPHELARVVLAEQLYRAFTILARHPYHTGH